MYSRPPQQERTTTPPAPTAKPPAPVRGHRAGAGISRRALLGGAAGLAVAAAGGGYLWTQDRSAPVGSASAAPSIDPNGPRSYERLSSPARTVVRASDGTVLATFTDGARSCVLTGTSRTWSEPRTTSATVTSDAHVRLMPEAWSQGREKTAWFQQWFPKALTDTSPDVLDTAFEYGDKAPSLYTKSGLRYAGDAQFGPVVPGQSELSFHYHDEKSDFYDYLGISWKFPDGTVKQPEKARLGDVDCSGFMRLVWGYRAGYPLHTTNTPGTGLPRRAYAIAAYAPGVLLIPDTHTRPADISPLQPGDLVFFAINIGKPIFLDHCGMYLGLDDGGHPRFISSRSQANGPTMGDLAGRATLDGNGFYAAGLRVARRL